MKTIKKVQETTWFYYVPSNLPVVIRRLAIDAEDQDAFLGLYLSIAEFFVGNPRETHVYTKSEIISYLKDLCGEYFSGMDDILQCKWLFHSEVSKDGKEVLIQPTFVLSDKRELKTLTILDAIVNQDYPELLKLSPVNF